MSPAIPQSSVLGLRLLFAPMCSPPNSPRACPCSLGPAVGRKACVILPDAQGLVWGLHFILC